MSVPAAPTDVTVVPGVGQATVSWTASTSTVTGYKIFCDPDNKLPNLAGPNATSLIVTKLKNGTPHSFRVHALSGTDMSATSAPAVPGPPPAAPKVTVVRGPGRFTVTVSGKAVAGSSLSYYNVSVTPAPSYSVPTNISLTTPTVITGLTAGTSYVVSATLTGPTGTSAATSAPAIIAVNVPDAPVLSGMQGIKSIQLSWTTPAGNGLPVLGYIISYFKGSDAPTILQVKAVNLQMIKTLLTGTAYTFTIQAKNAIGNSVESNSLTLTPT